MLSLAAQDVADRLVAPLIAFAKAVSHILALDTDPAALDAQALLRRVADIAFRLARIAAFGLRLRKRPGPKDDPTPTKRQPRSARGPLRLPRTRGWMLQALPEAALATAAELDAILADPALPELLAASPSLHRALKSVLRGLDLTLPAPAPTPDPPTRRSPYSPGECGQPPGQTPITPTPANPDGGPIADSRPFHSVIVTISAADRAHPATHPRSG